VCVLISKEKIKHFGSLFRCGISIKNAQKSRQKKKTFLSMFSVLFYCYLKTARCCPSGPPQRRFGCAVIIVVSASIWALGGGEKGRHFANNMCLVCRYPPQQAKTIHHSGFLFL
jgi:hypothetical protein